MLNYSIFISIFINSNFFSSSILIIVNHFQKKKKNNKSHDIYDIKFEEKIIVHRVIQIFL